MTAIPSSGVAPNLRQPVKTQNPLKGAWEITTGDGRTRRFEPGSILRVEDTEGKGHTIRMVGETEALAAVIQLPD